MCKWILIGLFPADTVKVVNLQGCPSKGLVSELVFDFSIETLGKHMVLHQINIVFNKNYFQQRFTNKYIGENLLLLKPDATNHLFPNSLFAG